MSTTTANAMTARDRLDYVKAAIKNSPRAWAFAYESAKLCDRANAGEFREPGYKFNGRNTLDAIVRSGEGYAYGAAFQRLIECVNGSFEWLHASSAEIERGFSEVVRDVENFEAYGERTDQHGATYAAEDYGDGQERFSFVEPNRKGERLLVIMRRCNHDRANRHDLMNAWRRAGYVAEFMPSHIVVECYVTDRLGASWNRYDPTVKPGGAGYVINFDWILEDTPENRARLLDEAARRFYACDRVGC